MSLDAGLEPRLRQDFLQGLNAPSEAPPMWAYRLIDLPASTSKEDHVRVLTSHFTAVFVSVPLLQILRIIR